MAHTSLFLSDGAICVEQRTMTGMFGPPRNISLYRKPKQPALSSTCFAIPTIGMTILNGNHFFFTLIQSNNIIYCRTAASTVLCSVYGWDPIEPKDDLIVERINGLVNRIVHAALPGTYLVENFPLMKYLPSWMARWKREGLEWHAQGSEMLEGFLFDVKERVVGIQMHLTAIGLIYHFQLV